MLEGFDRVTQVPVSNVCHGFGKDLIVCFGLGTHQLRGVEQFQQFSVSVLLVR